MKRLLIIILILSSLFTTPALSGEVPYVFNPSVPYTAFSAMALYETGHYGEALGACEWLDLMRKEDGSWGETSFSSPSPKFTALSLMSLMRCENLARGLYNHDINSAAYWLLYVQNDDGSFGDVMDTALSVIALREYTESGEINVGPAVERGEKWLEKNHGRNEVEELFRLLALGDLEGVKAINLHGEDRAYLYFALAYMGEEVTIEGTFKTPIGNALALFASGSEEYYEALTSMESFGFWGVKRYNTVELLDAAEVDGFEELKPIACRYIDMISPRSDVEKVVFARYLMECGVTPDLNVNESALLPWMVAEIARVKSLMGEDYSAEINRLRDGNWGDFYNTAYVVWVLHSLNESVPEDALEYLKENLTEGYPTYYYAYALRVFHDFGMEEFNETLEILKDYQRPNGGFGYNEDSSPGLRSTALVLQALEYAGVKNEVYKEGREFIRDALYADIPEVERDGDTLKLQNATFLLIRDSRFVGREENMTSMDGLDGVVVVYPSESPLTVDVIPINGFSPAEHGLGMSRILPAALLAFVLIFLVARRRS